jgi:hypothetical protein
MSFLMTPEDVRRVVDEAVKAVRDQTLRQVSKWVDANRNALTVDLSTGRYINIEDVLLYLFEAQSWPLDPALAAEPGLREAQLEAYGDWLVENGLPPGRRAAAIQRAALFGAL